MRAETVECEIISPHPLCRVFDEYLTEYQDDICRIVGKFRLEYHVLSHEELVSEVNLSLIKKRDEILSRFEGEFNKVAFSKMAYAFTRNIISWSHHRLVRTKYNAKRQDSEHQTEDGYKTSFELAVETKGEEDPHFESFDESRKCEFLLKMIREYACILTDTEIKTLALLERGLTQTEISEKLGVTHQAVSWSSAAIFEKIRCHFGSLPIKDDSYENVTKGHKSIDDFFSKQSGNGHMTNKDKEDLKFFLLQNIRCYTSSQIAKKLFDNFYTPLQIKGFAVRNKIYFCILRDSKKPTTVYSDEDSKSILKLYKEGKTTVEISKATGFCVRSLRSKLGSWTRKGVLDYQVGTNKFNFHK